MEQILTEFGFVPHAILLTVPQYRLDYYEHNKIQTHDTLVYYATIDQNKLRLTRLYATSYEMSTNDFTFNLGTDCEETLKLILKSTIHE